MLVAVGASAAVEAAAVRVGANTEALGVAAVDAPGWNMRLKTLATESDAGAGRAPGSECASAGGGQSAGAALKEPDMGDGATTSPAHSGEAAALDASIAGFVDDPAAFSEAPTFAVADLSAGPTEPDRATCATCGCSSGLTASPTARFAALRRIMLFNSKDLSADAADGARLLPASPTDGV